ncbi:uncharacterized protein LOC135820291 [Sycon ciliatum]|uniref:uncharacterized protein LOC135820291 n=1 Tax=Sycon ciliatum TaxID=27933 RepID=UPI0020AC5DF9|eukprot:scpid85339/ scgid21254/ Serine/threonine-protein kinase AFC1
MAVNSVSVIVNVPQAVRSVSGKATYTMRSCLDQGAFANVIMAIRDSDQFQVAVKISKCPEKRRSRELKVLEKIRDSGSSCHVTRLLDSVTCVGHQGPLPYGIVLEKGDTNMHDWWYSHKNRADLPPLVIPEIGRQVYAALEFIHGIMLVHCDLNMQNILLFRAEGIIKLCDFGASNFNSSPRTDTYRLNDLRQTACKIVGYMWTGRDLASRPDEAVNNFIENATDKNVLREAITYVMPQLSKGEKRVSNRFLADRHWWRNEIETRPDLRKMIHRLVYFDMGFGNPSIPQACSKVPEEFRHLLELGYLLGQYRELSAKNIHRRFEDFLPNPARQAVKAYLSTQ